MNPLLWKREHRIALYAAIGFGATLGLIWAIYGLDRDMYLFNDYVLVVAERMLFGASVAGAIVYIFRLSQS